MKKLSSQNILSRITIGVILIFIPLLSSCKSIVKLEGESEYAFNARAKFEEAKDSLDGGYYMEAIKQFNEVKTQFPFSKYAISAELEIANAYFQQEDFTQAIDAYRYFIKLHPNHKDVPFAMYRVGLSYYEQAPHDWFLFPPASENDQTPTKNALASFKRYLKRYGDDENSGDARKKITECTEMLASAEYNVAKFYSNRDHYKAAIGRLETLRKDYTEFDDYGNAMIMLAKLYIKTGEHKKAKAVLNDVITVKPDEKSVKKASKMSEEISGKEKKNGQ